MKPTPSTDRAALVGELQNAVMQLRVAGVLSKADSLKIETLATERLQRLESEIIEARRFVLLFVEAIGDGRLTPGRSFVRAPRGSVLVHVSSALQELWERHEFKEFPWGAARMVVCASAHLSDLVAWSSVRAVVGGKRVRCIELLLSS